MNKHVLIEFTVRVAGLLFLILVVGMPAQAQFVQDPVDSAAADTLAMVVAVSPDSASGLYAVRLDLYLFIDGNQLIGAVAGFEWDNPRLQMDSAKVTHLVDSAFNLGQWLYFKNDIDSTNAPQKFERCRASSPDSR